MPGLSQNMMHCTAGSMHCGDHRDHTLLGLADLLAYFCYNNASGSQKTVLGEFHATLTEMTGCRGTVMPSHVCSGVMIWQSEQQLMSAQDPILAEANV